METVETDDQSLEFLNLNESSYEPSFHDIYDEMANLERWQEMLNEMLNNENISLEEYDNEMLKSNYFMFIKTRNFILDDDEKKIVDDLREYKKALTNNFKLQLITNEEFEIEYIKILRKEYYILLLSKHEEKTDIKIAIIDPDLPLSEKLKKIQDEEIRYNKSICKKLNLDYPIKPSNYSDEYIDNYYYTKLNSGEDEILETYINKLNVVKKIIDYNTSSFEMTKVLYNPELKKTVTEFKKVPPINQKILKLKVTEDRSNLLTTEEQIYSERLNILRSNMRNKMTREELLECIGPRVFKMMTFIERLRQNKQPVLKFIEKPKNYAMLEKLLEEDSKFYKIPSDKLFKDYVYSLPDVIETEGEGFTNYLEKGNIIKLALKSGTTKKSVEEFDENDFDVIKPLEDKLYRELKSLKGVNTEPDLVWELRTSLPGSKKQDIVKRYLDFNDYLSDLKNKLINNLSSTKGKSRDILAEKIRKISYYLQYNIDLDTVKVSGQLSLDQLIKNRAEILEIRKEGIFKLMEYITSYYEGSQVLVEKIENDIYNFSTKDYKFNIDKIIFIFKNYSEKLEDLVERNESIITLLNFEVPKILPKDDVDLSDKPGTIEYLLNWKPYNENLERHRSLIETYNYNFKKFMVENQDLMNIEKEMIIKEYNEEIQWSNSLKKYNKLEVPSGYIEINFRLRFLLKERNKLPSRRIYRITDLKERMLIQKKLKSLFGSCKVEDAEKYSEATENIIFSLSYTPDDYIYYKNIVINTYEKLCSMFYKVNVKLTIDSSGKVLTSLKFDSIKVTPYITEFLIKEGNLEYVNIEKIKNLMALTPDDVKLQNYINTLRKNELDSYNHVLTTPSEIPFKNKWVELVKVHKSNLFKQRIEELNIIISNTYKPPIVSREKPIKRYFNNIVDLDYIKVGDNYIYGGYYPLFSQYNEEGDVIKDNYTRQDLEQLATIFNVDFKDDSYELYKDILTVITDYENVPVTINKKIYVPSDYNPYYEYLKTPNKIINYYIRPKLGVPEPGEVYNVTKDPIKVYGVPFKYDEQTIPVYSLELKILLDNSFITIEGPCKFEKTSVENKITSDSYILVEYLDSRQKPILFREGVASKNIIKRSLKSINTCSRFIDKTSCDSENSYSLEIKGFKYKCKWLDEKCKGILVESNEIKNFNINSVRFKSFELNSNWKNAVKKSIRYVESLSKIENLDIDRINKISKEQKINLIRFYKELLVLDNKSPKLETIKEYENNHAFEIKDILDNISSGRKITIDKRVEDKDYIPITLYTIKSYKQKLPMRLIIDKEYNVDNKTVIIKHINYSDNTVTVEVKDTTEILILEKEKFRKELSTVYFRNEPIFSLVKKEDYDMLNSFNEYFWVLEKNVIEKINKDTVVNRLIKDVKTFVPTNLIVPTSEVNGKPLITKEDIYKTIKSIAFSVLTTEDDIIFNIKTKVLATEDAIDFAIKNNINIIKIQEQIAGTIQLSDVILFFEKNKSKDIKIISKTELIKLFTKAVDDKDKETLKKYILQAKSNNLDKDLINQAKVVINSSTKPKEPEPIEQPKGKEKVPEAKTNSFVSKRRI